MYLIKILSTFKSLPNLEYFGDPRKCEKCPLVQSTGVNLGGDNLTSAGHFQLYKNREPY